MPQRSLVFHAGRGAPDARAVRMLSAVVEQGWTVTVAHLPGAAEAVRKLDLPMLSLPEPGPSPYLERIAARRAELERELAAVGGPGGPPAARVDETRMIRARLRALEVAVDLPSPLTAGTEVGDLARWEIGWHRQAAAVAEVPAAVLWAADLTGLPPLRWAAEAANPRPALVYDARCLREDLAWAPPLYREMWRTLADRFTAYADVVIVGSADEVLPLSAPVGQTVVLPESSTADPQATAESTILTLVESLAAAERSGGGWG